MTMYLCVLIFAAYFFLLFSLFVWHLIRANISKADMRREAIVPTQLPLWVRLELLAYTAR